MNKIIGIYKEKGPTSHDVIDRLRRITGIKKIGHAGTLDPLAEGVLVVGIGREATKQLGKEVKKEKEYSATIKMGGTSTTDDEEGDKTVKKVKSIPTKKQIQDATKLFEGNIKQIPPIFSAVKVGGKEAYKMARKGKVVELGPRDVEIKKVELIDYRWPLLTIKVITGPGVYIRSLARDIGEKLGVGGYLKQLKRTRVGEFSESNALTLVQFEKQYRKENV
ncbi:tRNA pseudouridine(55) synthase TruB [Patescibacteria group bacterium]|nr:tRNA pseudouridine(55) synthase TruB [Patescibacteria group bacterium]MBU1952272.1 tRNA pseudouridine(55) synthase TruB [Patescibacteria group bacterium]